MAKNRYVYVMPSGDVCRTKQEMKELFKVPLDCSDESGNPVDAVIEVCKLLAEKLKWAENNTAESMQEQLDSYDKLMALGTVDAAKEYIYFDLNNPEILEAFKKADWEPKERWGTTIDDNGFDLYREYIVGELLNVKIALEKPLSENESEIWELLKKSMTDDNCIRNDAFWFKIHQLEQKH